MDGRSPTPAMSIAQPTSLIESRKVRRLTSAGPSGFASVITVNVGVKPGRKTFILHDRALCRDSNYFANAMDLHRRAAEQDEPINLADMTAEDFTVYTKFLYTGLIFTREGNTSELARCLQLYKAAIRLDAMDFRDAIVDALIETICDIRSLKGQSRFTSTQIKTIYAIAVEGSPLRKLAHNLCLQSKEPHRFEKKQLKDFPAEFQLDLLAAAAPFITSSTKSTDMPDPLDLNLSCDYHEHAALSKPCYRLKYHDIADQPTTIAANGVETPAIASASRRSGRLVSKGLELRA